MTTKPRVADPRSRLKELGADVLAQLEKKKNPAVSLPVRSLSNIYFDEKHKIIQLGTKTSQRSYMNVAHTRKFMQTLMVAAECKKLLDQKQNTTTSIRDLYYILKRTLPGTDENSVDDQSESDAVLEDIEAAMNTLRENLHLKAEQKGKLVGPIIMKDLKFETQADGAKMGSSGWGIPSIVEADTIEFGKCDAEFILMVEKDAIWQRLNEDRFWQKHKCLVLTAGGQPDRGTRRLINRLHTELKLPVYVLTDADVWGYYIYSVIKQGSINLSFVSDRLGTPDAKFIGLTTQDVAQFAIPKNVVIKLNEGDKKRAQELLNYVWFKPKPWQHEIKHMLQVGYKLELEALSAKDIRFISEKYLPQKIKQEDFLP